MDNLQLDTIFKNLLGEITGGQGKWSMLVQGMRMTCWTDVMHNRMRIITPIIETQKLTVSQLKKCMEANFHSVLDVKYAISDGQLWVVYIHPLKELTEQQVREAINQLYSAFSTFGSTYTGGTLTFPSQDEFRSDLN